MAKFQSFTFKLKVPFTDIGLEGTWAPDEDERNAAWELYVELITRVAVVELKPDEGLIRELMASLHSLFDTTRKILREHGPNVAKPKGNGSHSFGTIAIVVLNDVIRPFLARWHPVLTDWEEGRPTGVSATAHEAAWRENSRVRAELHEVQTSLAQYAELLARVAGVPSLTLH